MAPTEKAVQVQYALGELCCPFCGASLLANIWDTYQWLEQPEGWNRIGTSRSRLYCTDGHIIADNFRILHDDEPVREWVKQLLLEASKRGHPL